MFRVTRNVPGDAGPPNNPSFLKVEIVLKYRDGDAKLGDGRAYVKNYKGNSGQIADDSLEHIPFAWGLRVQPNELKKILEKMARDDGARPPGQPTSAPGKHGPDDDEDDAAPPAPKRSKDGRAKPPKVNPS